MRRFKLQLELVSTKNVLEAWDWIENKLLDNPKVRELNSSASLTHDLQGYQRIFLYSITTDREYNTLNQALANWIPKAFKFTLIKEPSFTAEHLP